MTPSPRDPAIEPDTKDWTWVLARACPECGYDARAVPPHEIGERIRASAQPWPGVLDDQRAGVRPAAGVWSPLEYAAHVRDVHRVFGERVRSMLACDDPLFDDWDQDAAAVLGAYGAQHPATVAGELAAAAEQVGALYDSVTGEQWDRPGRRGNGSRFTTLTIARYHLHDAEHHLVDVRG